MNGIDWKAWLQMVLGAVTSFGGPTAALIAMIGNGVLSLDETRAEDVALAKKWFDWCNQVIVVENREFTEEERAEARAFADEVHARNQAA